LRQTEAWTWTRSSHAAQILESGGGEIILSVVSFWEISLKFSLGKLDLKGVTPPEMTQTARDMQLAILPIESEDAATYHLLQKTTYKDPFDRMIVWQCIRRQWPLISSDRLLDLYKPQGLILVR